jgi:hypothetical protein
LLLEQQQFPMIESIGYRWNVRYYDFIDIDNYLGGAILTRTVRYEALHILPPFLIVFDSPNYGNAITESIHSA